MVFEELELSGAFLIEPELERDERGFFARTFCQREFARRGLVDVFVQTSVSFNHSKGTLRGMHYEVAPHDPAKLVRCTAGGIYDVILDLRPGSPTRMRWISAELTASNRRMLYVPKGFAHGFQALTDGAEVFYQMSEFYVPGASRGVRWNDPRFGIRWPEPPTVISERDRSYPDSGPDECDG